MNIEKLRELREKATAGPWEIVQRKSTTSVESDGRVICDDEQYYPQAVSLDDMRLFVAMRNALPALLVLAEQAQWAVRNCEPQWASDDGDWAERQVLIEDALNRLNQSGEAT